VPTPDGPIDVHWTGDHGRFVLWLRAPRGTSGTVAVPASGDATVRVNGRTVWSAARAIGDAADREGDSVLVRDVTGSSVVSVG
jgi:hypothetical protein